jgi:hypothetical protein
MLAVFERIDLSLLETILAASKGESSLQMVTFKPSSTGRSVPDARISARFAYWFEVKTARNALDSHQLAEHLANLGDEGGAERLFVVTPDAEQPTAIAGLSDPRVVWFNFRSLHDAVDAAASDPTGTVSEQARFLLRELQALLVEDGLVDSDDVVVVAARFAYPKYLKRSVYVCQPARAFRGGLTHMGFYANSAIQVHVPRIWYREDLVTFTHEEAAARTAGSDTDRLIGEVIQTLLNDGDARGGQAVPGVPAVWTRGSRHGPPGPADRQRHRRRVGPTLGVDDGATLCQPRGPDPPWHDRHSDLGPNDSGP